MTIFDAQFHIIAKFKSLCSFFILNSIKKRKKREKRQTHFTKCRIQKSNLKTSNILLIYENLDNNRFWFEIFDLVYEPWDSRFYGY